MNTPVLFIIFKRYDTALQVFNSIRKAQPTRLYVAADAPRKGVEGEVEDCNRTRNIAKLVDWPCEVKTLFQTENQGCGIGPYKAISWFFKNEERGIILEDDCCPHPDFFGYCEELLEKYDLNSSITLITGRNNFKVNATGEDSYFLSALHFCWGWASWRRVWETYDYSLSKITAHKYFKALLKYFGWRNIFTIMWRMNLFYFCKHKQPRDIWDYQFCITTQMNKGYTIVPVRNLVRNIGNDERATHTAGHVDDIPVGPILPLKHPNMLKYDNRPDIMMAKQRYGNRFKLVYHFARNLIGI